MSGSAGSTKLTEKQGKWFKKRYGVTFLHVQTNADRPSRSSRRAHRRSLRRRNDGAPFGGWAGPVAFDLNKAA